MNKVLLDTNFLVLPFQEKIDVFKAIEELILGKYIPLVLVDTVNEILDKISFGKPTERRMFRSALSLVTKYCVIVGDSFSSEKLKVDDKILLFAISEECVVATNDRELRRRLRSSGVSVIYYRESKRRLELDGVLE